MTRACLAVGLALWALPAPAAVPPVLIPPHADTVSTRTPAGPLLVPGRVNPSDTLAHARPRTPQEHYAMGRELERTGHPAAAIVAYSNAVHLDPTFPDAHFRMGLLYGAVSQHKAAAEQYAAELRIRPDNRVASRLLGLEQAEMGDTASAIVRLRGLVESGPDDEPAWQALGFAYGVAGRPRQGEHALRRALTLDPLDGDAWRDLGVVLNTQGREAEAREAYARAAKLLPRDPGVYVNLGNMDRRAKRYEQALADYREALGRDSTEALAWRGQVTVLTEMGRAADAGTVYRHWLERTPNDVGLRVQAMEHFASMGRKDVALELAREGVRHQPNSPEAHLALGMALHESGAERAALPELRRAQDLFLQAVPSARVGALIRSMRAQAPDSLRALFAADSLKYEVGMTRISVDSLTTKPPLR